jgi:hypothetical protein
MKASEARKLSQHYAQSADIDKLWGRLMKRIKDVAETTGRTEITHPWSGLHSERCSTITREQQDALRKRLIAEGYSVVDHPDPDPGHPASGPYTTVSW